MAMEHILKASSVKTNPMVQPYSDTPPLLSTRGRSKTVSKTAQVLIPHLLRQNDKPLGSLQRRLDQRRQKWSRPYEIFKHG